MTKKSPSSFSGIWFSIIGIISVFLIFLAVNVFVKNMRLRVDLTEDRMFTLSEGTHEILNNLENPVTLRFYVSERNNAMPVFLRNYAQRIEYLLNEYALASDGMIEVQKLDPEPDSEAEDSANLDGVYGQPTHTGELVYLGVSITCIDQKVSLSFLSPERENLLEYDLSRAISQATLTEKPVLGLISGLSVLGSYTPQLNPMASATQQPEWIAFSELHSLFKIEELNPDTPSIPEHIDVLLLVHPMGITPETEFAVDQFLMRGGKILALLDPFSLAARLNAPNTMMMPPPIGSHLPTLLPAWGIQYSPDDVLSDPQYRTMINRTGSPEQMPTILSLTAPAINPEDVLTAQLDSILLPFSGSLQGTPTEGIQKTVLLHASNRASLVSASQAESPSQATLSTPQIAKLPLAIRLTGTFKSAFPNGAPESTSSDENGTESEGDTPDQTPGNESSSAEKTSEKKSSDSAPESLKESVDGAAVILFADADFIYDDFSVTVQNFLGQQIVTPRNGNLDLFLNAIEQLAGDNNLIAVRSRGSITRPFTVVSEMQAEAEEKYLAQIQALETELSETSRRLSELQFSKDENQRFILSPEQQSELEQFQKRQVEVRNELKSVRRSLRQDIDQLETRLKWINIALMPALVIFTGILIAIIRKKRTSAS